jgi:hypothetical protein
MRLPIQSHGVHRTASAAPALLGVEAAMKSCGACSELKWPNGTGTGACVKDCCTTVNTGHGPETRCSFESCSCGFNWPGGILHWLVF